MAETGIELTVNGRLRRATAEPRLTLADFLRERLQLTGTHLGCEHGACGACTILLDGEAVRSCLVFAVQADGGDVTTVEGLAGPDALRLSQELAKQEGIFCGITSGATFAGALQIAATAPKGTNILAMLPDTGERYLSTPLFADVPADMTEEEAAIFRSTPLFTEPAAS